MLLKPKEWAEEQMPLADTEVEDEGPF